MSFIQGSPTVRAWIFFASVGGALYCSPTTARDVGSHFSWSLLMLFTLAVVSVEGSVTHFSLQASTGVFWFVRQARVT